MSYHNFQPINRILSGLGVMIFVIHSSSGCLLTLPLTFYGEDDTWTAEIDLLLGDFRDLSFEEQAFPKELC